jgi:hypothetical protein
MPIIDEMISHNFNDDNTLSENSVTLYSSSNLNSSFQSDFLNSTKNSTSGNTSGFSASLYLPSYLSFERGDQYDINNNCIDDKSLKRSSNFYFSINHSTLIDGEYYDLKSDEATNSQNDLNIQKCGIYEVLLGDFVKLKSNLNKLRVDLFLNELKIELNCSIDRIKHDLNEKFSNKIRKLSEENQLFVKKIQNLECLIKRILSKNSLSHNFNNISASSSISNEDSEANFIPENSIENETPKTSSQIVKQITKYYPKFETFG